LGYRTSSFMNTYLRGTVVGERQLIESKNTQETTHILGTHVTIHIVGKQLTTHIMWWQSTLFADISTIS